MDTSDPMEAARWVRSGVEFPVPAFKLNGYARLVAAERGADWGAYHFDAEGKRVKLVIRRRSYEFKGYQPKTIGHTQFYIAEYVGWKCPSCAYELTGGDADLRWRLAQAAATEQFGTL
jgi:hypothetical protein